METLNYPTDVKAIKEHKCDFCAEKIRIGETYRKSTHKLDGDIYDWKTHKHCAEIASKLRMYDDADEGVSGDDFQEHISQEFFDLMINLFDKEDRKKYSTPIQCLRDVKFRDKLLYVIHHYKKLEKQTPLTKLK